MGFKEISELIALIIIIIIFLGIVLLIPAFCTYLVYYIFKDRLPKYFTYLLTSIIPVTLILLIYFAIYPGKRFYEDEFEDITELDFPSSGDIIRKNATYPGFLGDYSSCAVIKLNSLQFNELKEQISHNQSFKPGEFYGDVVLKEINYYKGLEDDVVQIYSRYNEARHYLAIAFLNDGKTVIIFKSVT